MDTSKPCLCTLHRIKYPNARLLPQPPPKAPALKHLEDFTPFHSQVRTRPLSHHESQTVAGTPTTKCKSRIQSTKTSNEPRSFANTFRLFLNCHPHCRRRIKKGREAIGRPNARSLGDLTQPAASSRMRQASVDFA